MGANQWLERRLERRRVGAQRQRVAKIERPVGRWK
jgi:hypothetical protein